MPHLLIKDLDAHTIEQLKRRAKSNGRSLQDEVKLILEAAVAYSLDEAKDVAAAWQQRLAGRSYTDSAETIRADRRR